MPKPFYAAGRYLAEIVNQGFNEAKTGTPQFYLQILIKAKVNPADPDGPCEEVQQFERTIYRALTENTIDYALQDWRDLGYEGTKLSDLDPETPNFHDFRGRPIEAICNIETFNGQTHERWQLARGGGNVPKPMERSKVKRLDQLFGKYIRASATAKPKPQVAAPVGGVIVDDDAPF